MALLTIDFHTHLLEKGVFAASYWKAVKSNKLNAVAITEHADESPEKAYRLLLEKKPKNVLLLPGLELNTSAGHVLAFAKNDDIYRIESLFKKNLPIKNAIKTAEAEELLLSIAHPWGLSYDSAAYLLGEKKLLALVEKEKIGVEAFNGMFGNVGSFFYATNWVKKPINFFDFLEKSRLGKKTRLSKLASKGKQKIDKKGRELLERCSKPYQLAAKAKFATAGSDAHKPSRIGTGITKLQVKDKSLQSVLEAVENKKNVKWLGPFVRETSKGYAVDKTSIQKTELLSGLQYAAKRAIMKKVSRKKANS